MSELDDALLRVRDGRITFDEFARDFDRQWSRISASIARRWKPPAWADQQDLKQELLLAAYKCLWDWDPRKGSSIGDFVLYNAYDKSKKAGHKARGAKLCGNADSNPSRTEPNFTRLFGGGHGDWDEGDWVEAKFLRCEPTQEQAMEKRDLVHRVLAVCRTERERHVVREAALAGLFEDALALDEDALVECAKRLYADVDVRRECRLGSQDQALRAAVDAAAAVRDRVLAVLLAA
jgi:hypothetical protein